MKNKFADTLKQLAIATALTILVASIIFLIAGLEVSKNGLEILTNSLPVNFIIFIGIPFAATAIMMLVLLIGGVIMLSMGKSLEDYISAFTFPPGSTKRKAAAIITIIILLWVGIPAGILLTTGQITNIVLIVIIRSFPWFMCCLWDTLMYITPETIGKQE